MGRRGDDWSGVWEDAADFARARRLTNPLFLLIKPLRNPTPHSVPTIPPSQGLKYEDCLIEKSAVKEAISLAPQEIYVGRNRRIKRALDLSYKKKNLQDYAPGLKLDPNSNQLRPEIDKILKRDEEVSLC